MMIKEEEVAGVAGDISRSEIAAQLFIFSTHFWDLPVYPLFLEIVL